MIPFLPSTNARRSIPVAGFPHSLRLCDTIFCDAPTSSDTRTTTSSARAANHPKNGSPVPRARCGSVPPRYRASRSRWPMSSRAFGSATWRSSTAIGVPTMPTHTATPPSCVWPRPTSRRYWRRMPSCTKPCCACMRGASVNCMAWWKTSTPCHCGRGWPSNCCTWCAATACPR